MSQIFLSSPPISIIVDFLKKYADYINDSFFYITEITYKKALYNDDIKSFCESLSFYYRKSKLKYVKRDVNYKQFLTIIRQICNYHNVVYSYFIQYDKSGYNICYKVYIKKT